MAYTTIDDPSAQHQTLLYSGNNDGGGQTHTNTGNSDLQPDWMWIKHRTSASFNHYMVDSSRGENNSVHVRLVPNGLQSEADGYTHNFATDGWESANNNATVNGSATYAAWQWKCNGGTTASNSNGSITSTVQANTTAGFSIVLWTGNGSDATIGHGLSSAPEMYVVKNRSDSADWRVGQTVAGNTMTAGRGYYMEWNDNKASTNPGSNVTWGSTPTAPTSSVFTVGSNNAHNGNGDSFVAYCFHSVQGYSKIGEYIGNGSSNGPFIYTGFKPAWLLIKETGNANEWRLFDNKRNAHNPVTTHFETDTAGAETDGGTTHNQFNFLSNGFKCRADNAGCNRDGGSYLYMTFAEHPFVSSEGVPVTAR